LYFFFIRRHDPKYQWGIPLFPIEYGGNSITTTHLGFYNRLIKCLFFLLQL
jgi:hypothetical protein